MTVKTKRTLNVLVICLVVIHLLIFAGQAAVFREGFGLVQIAASEDNIFVLVNIENVGSKRNGLINPFALSHAFDGKLVFCSLSQGVFKISTYPDRRGVFFPERNHAVFLHQFEYCEPGQNPTTGRYYKCTPSGPLLVEGKPVGEETSDFRVGLWPGDDYESICDREKDTCFINVKNGRDTLKITRQYNLLDKNRDQTVDISVGQEIVQSLRIKSGETITW